MYLKIKSNKNIFITPSSKFSLFYILFTLIVSFSSVNITLTLLSLFTLYISIRLVWRVNEPPIIAFILFYHWMQISTKIIHANILGVDIQKIAISNSSDQAIFLSLLGLLSISFGVNIFLRKINILESSQLNEYAQMYSLQKLFKVYIAFFFVYIFFKGLMFIVPGLAQVIASFLKLTV